MSGEHGTYATYQAEKRAGVPCKVCREAQAIYIRQWRRRTQIINPLNDLLDRRPELRELPQAGVRFVVGAGENA